MGVNLPDDIGVFMTTAAQAWQSSYAWSALPKLKIPAWVFCMICTLTDRVDTQQVHGQEAEDLPRRRVLKELDGELRQGGHTERSFGPNALAQTVHGMLLHVCALRAWCGNSWCTFMRHLARVEAP